MVFYNLLLLLLILGLPLFAEDGEAGSFDPNAGISIDSIQNYVNHSDGEALDSTYKYDSTLTPEEYQILLEFSEHGGRHPTPLVPVESYQKPKQEPFQGGPGTQQGRRKRKSGFSFSEMAETIKKK